MPPRMVIDPNAVFAEGDVSLALGIPLSTLERARRSGELQAVKCGRQVFILGSNLLGWLTPAVKRTTNTQIATDAPASR